jgi:hypothetical protein
MKGGADGKLSALSGDEFHFVEMSLQRGGDVHPGLARKV